MKKSKLKAEIKILKFWKKRHKKKLRELIRVVNSNANDLDWCRKRVDTLEFKADKVIAELSTLKISNALTSSRFKS